MVEIMDSAENQSEVNVLLDPGHPENESRNQSLEPRPSLSECLGRTGQNGCMEESKVQMQLLGTSGDAQRGMEQDTGVPGGMEADRCRLKCHLKASLIMVIVGIFVLSFLISISFNVIQHGQIQTLQMTSIALEEQAINQTDQSTSTPPGNTSCLQGWIGSEGGYCYFFSNGENTWNVAYNSCSSSGASLVALATWQERDFIIKHKVPAEYWLDLRREKIELAWRRSDGSDFNIWFEIKGEGHCATLNDDVVSSTNCNKVRRWICCKPLHAV